MILSRIRLAAINALRKKAEPEYQYLVDWQGINYIGPCQGLLRLETSPLYGEVTYQNIAKLIELISALKYGKYLEKQGYEFIVADSYDTLTYKLCWYLDPAEKLLNIKDENGRPLGMWERTFAVRFNRHMFADSTEWRADIESWSRDAAPMRDRFNAILQKHIRKMTAPLR